jgi:hypothetical protein
MDQHQPPDEKPPNNDRIPLTPWAIRLVGGITLAGVLYWAFGEAISKVASFVDLILIGISAILGMLFNWFVLLAFRDPNGKPALSRFVRSLVSLTVFSLFSIATIALAHSDAFRPEPTPTNTPTPTSTFTPTPTPYKPPCTYSAPHFPCVDKIIESNPPDNLYELCRRNYRIDGDCPPEYWQQICDANDEFLRDQFFRLVPANERDMWDHYCHFVIPDNELWIPAPPVPTPTITPSP